MKKVLALVLAALMCFSMVALVSCSDKTPKIGVQTGTTGEYFVKGDADWGFDGIEGYEAKGFGNGGLAVEDMKNGAIKYVIIDEQPAKQLEKRVEGIKVIDIGLTDEKYAFGVDKAQSALRDSINTILAEMKESGKLNEIVAAYATGEGIKPFTSATFDEAKRDTQLVVATNAEFAPFEYMVGEQYAGIDMEIAAYIAEQLGMELVIKNMAFDAVVTSVGKDGVDVAMAGLTVNEKREEFVNFTDTYYDAAQMLVVLESNKDFDDCKTADDVLKVLKDNLAK